MLTELMKKNRDFIRTLKGGVIMDVTTPDEAKIAEDAGAVAVMALERVPADIRAAGGVARMSDPGMIVKIKESVKIPVMAKCRIGHIAEARILEVLRNSTSILHFHQKDLGKQRTSLFLQKYHILPNSSCQERL